MDFSGFSDRTRRNGPGVFGRTLFGRTAALCALFASATVAAAVPPAHAAPEKLTLENAQPLPVPPRPRLGTPKPVKAPPRFVTPVPFEAPPLPEMTVGPQQQPSAPPAPGVAPAPVPVPAPAPAVAAKPAPATPTPSAPVRTQTETAALPPPPVAAPPAASAPPSSVLSLVFDGAATNLPDAAENTVDRIVQRLRASDTARLQLRSYATGTSDTAREARQLSLARALSLRERLTAFGVRSSRIDIRALGMESSGGDPDRIDVEFLNE